jgi:hypothetical protein
MGSALDIGQLSSIPRDIDINERVGQEENFKIETKRPHVKS